jgi:geranyl-CoA carboxylase beta subunit
MERAGMPVNDAMLEGMSGEIRKRLDAEANVLFGTARLWDDGVIDPRDTRRVLSMCLDMAEEAEQRLLRPNTFGVARL